MDFKSYISHLQVGYNPSTYHLLTSIRDQSMRVASKIHLSCEFGGVPPPRLSSLFAVMS